MSTADMLKVRSNNTCELCKSTDSLAVYEVAPQEQNSKDNTIYICSKCEAQIEKKKNWIARIGNASQKRCGARFRQCR